MAGWLNGRNCKDNDGADEMNAAQRDTMDHLRAAHAQLDLDAMGFRQPGQYRLTLWTQYRRWLWNGLRSGSFAAVAMGAALLTIYAHVWGIW